MAQLLAERAGLSLVKNNKHDWEIMNYDSSTPMVRANHKAIIRFVATPDGVWDFPMPMVELPDGTIVEMTEELQHELQSFCS